MATNPYFNKKSSAEQNLYESLVVECNKMYGFDFYYIPRVIVAVDNILNENIESVFNRAFTLEMYVENTDGFTGDGTLLSKFGLQIRDTATLILARRTWNNVVGSGRPLEGDLIYDPLTKSLFSITFVEHEVPFYQLANLTVYKLTVEKFEYRNETINTGIDDLDSSMKNATSELILTISGGNGIEFRRNELISQIRGNTDKTVNAIVVSFEAISPTTRALTVSNWSSSDGKYAEFEAGKEITGSLTGAIWTVQSVDHELTEQNSFAKNDVFEAEANDIVEFNPNNPFGE